MTDTVANEVKVDPNHDVVLSLRSALRRSRGVTFAEITWLGALAEVGAADGRWTFMCTAAPLRVGKGTGALLKSGECLGCRGCAPVGLEGS